MSRASRRRRVRPVEFATEFTVESLELRRLLSGAFEISSTITDPSAPASGAFGRGVATNGNLALVASPGLPNTDPSASAGKVSLVDTTNGQILRTFAEPVADQVEGDQFGAAVAWVGNKIAIADPEAHAGGAPK